MLILLLAGVIIGVFVVVSSSLDEPSPKDVNYYNNSSSYNSNTIDLRNSQSGMISF